MLILPYAFPAFLSALVWAGMMNESFGFINQVLLGGAEIPWLTDPWLAKISVLLVNLWLGFPYMFLVCMGALQGIPEDVNEAGVMDGANPWQIFRRIKLPLLLVTVTPLLIASFAFNFNNFNLIYMLTDGGPRLEDTADPRRAHRHPDLDGLQGGVHRREPRLRPRLRLHDPHLHRGRRDLDRQLPQDQGPRGVELT